MQLHPQCPKAIRSDLPQSDALPTPALITALLNSCQGSSDLIFSPGIAPQVEGSGRLITPAIAGLNLLTPHDTAKIAVDEGSADLLTVKP